MFFTPTFLVLYISGLCYNATKFTISTFHFFIFSMFWEILALFFFFLYLSALPLFFTKYSQCIKMLYLSGFTGAFKLWNIVLLQYQALQTSMMNNSRLAFLRLMTSWFTSRDIWVKIIALIVPFNNMNFEYTVWECPGGVIILLYQLWYGIYFRSANNLEEVSPASYTCSIT